MQTGAGIPHPGESGIEPWGLASKRTVRVVLAGSLALGGALTAVLIGGALPASAAATVIQTMPVGTNPSGVSSDGTHVWVTNLNSNTVSELDASTGSVIQTIGLGAYYGPSGVSSDGTHVWVADQGVATVTELNASTGSVVQTIGVGTYPYSVSSDGTHVWVANGSNTVTELNASTGSVVQTIGVGTYPYSVSSDGTHVWVANQGSNTVTEISIVGFTITTSSLPNATPGVAYGPVTLQAANMTVSTSPYTTALKWKKVTGPRGLKLSSAGVLSGTPTARLQAGPSSVAVQVTETVTTLNGKKKVKTLSTVQATIPLTIT